jgi:hypothetical protein
MSIDRHRRCAFTLERIVRFVITKGKDFLDWRLFCAFLLLAGPAGSLRATQSVSLVWNASPDARTTGYTLVYGNASGVYSQTNDVGNVTQATVAGLTEGSTYYFAVFAYAGISLQSVLSNEVAYQVPSLTPATVVSRSIFYNGSAWDGNDPAANANDDAAIAPDKMALLPGGIATLSNYTSYSRGINGVMVDISGLGATLTANDFTFRIGNNSNPGTWPSAPAPSSITVRPGAGVGGSDRITLIWADNQIQDTWLQVTVQATQNTRLASPDVFYFGNAIGESGNSPLNATVTSADALQVLNNINPLPGTLTLALDFNRDKKVTSADALIVLNNLAVGPSALQLINLSANQLAPMALGSSTSSGSHAWAMSGASPSVLASGPAAEILGLTTLDADWTVARCRYAANGPVQVWWTTSLKPADWRELPSDWIASQGNDLYEVRIPSDQAGAWSFFRFASSAAGK